MTGTTKAVFLDRDGVLNVDHSYVYREEDLEIFPRVPSALRTLKDAGFLLIVVTNQSGVARGLFSLDDVDTFHRLMVQRIISHGGTPPDDFYICPHHPDGKVSPYTLRCNCRKPATGLIDAAVEKWGIDLARSYLVGDKPSDIELAKNAGVVGIQISDSRYGVSPEARYQAADLQDAAKFILDLESVAVD